MVAGTTSGRPSAGARGCCCVSASGCCGCCCEPTTFTPVHLCRSHPGALGGRHQVALRHHQGERRLLATAAAAAAAAGLTLLLAVADLQRPAVLQRSPQEGAGLPLEKLHAGQEVAGEPGESWSWSRTRTRTRTHWCQPVLQLHGKKQHIRALLIDRVLLQHQVARAAAAAPLGEFCV